MSRSDWSCPFCAAIISIDIHDCPQCGWNPSSIVDKFGYCILCHAISSLWERNPVNNREFFVCQGCRDKMASPRWQHEVEQLRKLVIKHHDVGAMKDFSWGDECPVCPKDHKEK